MTVFSSRDRKLTKGFEFHKNEKMPSTCNHYDIVPLLKISRTSIQPSLRNLADKKRTKNNNNNNN